MTIHWRGFFSHYQTAFPEDLRRARPLGQPAFVSGCRSIAVARAVWRQSDRRALLVANLDATIARNGAGGINHWFAGDRATTSDCTPG